MARKPKTNTEIGDYKYYRTILTIGIDIEGNPIKKQFYGKTKTEAENKKKDYIRSLESGINPDLSNQSLETAMYMWLWEIERPSGIKSSTFERYESIFRNYVQASTLGRINVGDIKKIALSTYYNELTAKGKSYSIVSNLHKVLNKFLRFAESEGYLIKNPASGLKIPKNNEEDIEEEANKIETFTQDEVKVLVKSLSHDKLRYVVLFALLTGAREGEILALKKSDIIGNKVRINKTIRSVKVFDDNKNSSIEMKVTKPKTKHSNREVPLPDILISELTKLDLLVKQEKLRLGPAYTDNDLLFPSTTGSYIDAKNLRKSWIRALKKAEIPYKRFHSLRHTYATRLFENDTSILTVSRLLGHSSIQTTEIYTHVLEDIKEREVQCLNSLFQ